MGRPKGSRNKPKAFKEGTVPVDLKQLTEVPTRITHYNSTQQQADSVATDYDPNKYIIRTEECSIETLNGIIKRFKTIVEPKKNGT